MHSFNALREKKASGNIHDCGLRKQIKVGLHNVVETVARVIKQDPKMRLWMFTCLFFLLVLFLFVDNIVGGISNRTGYIV